MIQEEQHDYHLDNLMNEVVDKLSEGHAKDAADGLLEIARYFAKAGMPQQSFLDLRQHLIQEAREKTGCPVFIKEQIEGIEREMREKRTGSIIVH